MEALAAISGTRDRRQQPQAGSTTDSTIRIILSGGLMEKAETKSMLEMIDQELKPFRNVAELDFTAGYLTGRIKEKNADGIITDTQAEQLTKVLYSKYEILRDLAERSGK